MQASSWLFSSVKVEASGHMTVNVVITESVACTCMSVISNYIGPSQSLPLRLLPERLATGIAMIPCMLGVVSADKLFVEY